MKDLRFFLHRNPINCPFVLLDHLSSLLIFKFNSTLVHNFKQCFLFKPTPPTHLNLHGKSINRNCLPSEKHVLWMLGKWSDHWTGKGHEVCLLLSNLSESIIFPFFRSLADHFFPKSPSLFVCHCAPKVSCILFRKEIHLNVIYDSDPEARFQVWRKPFSQRLRPKNEISVDKAVTLFLP